MKSCCKNRWQTQRCNQVTYQSLHGVSDHLPSLSWQYLGLTSMTDFNLCRGVLKNVRNIHQVYMKQAAVDVYINRTAGLPAVPISCRRLFVTIQVQSSHTLQMIPLVNVWFSFFFFFLIDRQNEVSLQKATFQHSFSQIRWCIPVT